MSDFINEKIIPPVMGFINTPVMQSLKDGLLYSMPLMIVGSVFMLLQQFPYTPVQDFLRNINVYDLLGTGYANTFSIMALIAAIGIPYTYVKKKGYNEALPAGVISLSCWLMAQPQTLMYAVTETEEVPVGGVIIRDWLAGRGMIASLIIGILVGIIYVWFLKKDITIKMPNGVPQGVAAAFTALIPAAAIILGMLVIIFIVDSVSGQTVLEIIYTMIQQPLSGLTDNLGGVFVYSIGIAFFWWFGIHGSIIMESILGAVITANMAENQTLFEEYGELTVNTPGVHIFTKQIIDNFVNVTGSGLTLGLVIYMLFFAKSEQMKSIGKLGIGPGIFNVNEPVLFGTPIVLNPMLLIPFMLAPAVAGCGTYLLIQMGILPVFKGLTIPWTMPAVLSGLLLGGWKCALWQAVLIVASFFIYFPFIKAYDNQCYKEEVEAEAAAE